MNINEILKSDYDLLCKDYKKATKKIEKQEQEIESLNNRIDKAIKFIKTHDLYHPTNEVILLNILKGSGSNE